MRDEWLQSRPGRTWRLNLKARSGQHRAKGEQRSAARQKQEKPFRLSMPHNGVAHNLRRSPARPLREDRILRQMRKAALSVRTRMEFARRRSFPAQQTRGQIQELVIRRLPILRPQAAGDGLGVNPIGNEQARGNSILKSQTAAVLTKLDHSLLSIGAAV